MPRPVPEVAASARAYQRRFGTHAPEMDYNRAFITEPASREVGNAYSRLPHFEAGALPAFHALREESWRQFDHLTGPRSRGGLGLHAEASAEDPYGRNDVNSIFKELHHDVTQNNRIKVLSAETTGGHPVLSNDDLNVFRTVHDVYGHLGSGRGVDHDGEEAAFQKHSRMYTPLARRAAATELRGQNSAFRVTGEFPENKIALLPEHMQSLQFGRQGSAADIVKAVQRSRRRSAEQGL